MTENQDLNPNKFNTESPYVSSLDAEIQNSFKHGDPIELFLKNEFGIENANSEFFPDLSEKDQSDFIFDNVRGSVPLQQGKILTVKETRALSDQVAKMDFKKMLLQFK